MTWQRLPKPTPMTQKLIGNRNINVTGLENLGKDAAEKIADIAEKVAEEKANTETGETK